MQMRRLDSRLRGHEGRPTRACQSTVDYQVRRESPANIALE